MMRPLFLALSTTVLMAAAPPTKGPWTKYDDAWEKKDYAAWTVELQVTKGTGVSCATAMKYPDTSVHRWVEGFWTGLNVATGSMVGRTTDNAGMFAELKLDCDKSPSDNFLLSVHKTWIRMRAAGK
jgi:hypothetical protein